MLEIGKKVMYRTLNKNIVYYVEQMKVFIELKYYKTGKEFMLFLNT